MYWNSLQDFLNMGGYAFFVWSSVLVSAICLAAELVLLHLRRTRLAAAGPRRPSGTLPPTLTAGRHEA